MRFYTFFSRPIEIDALEKEKMKMSFGPLPNYGISGRGHFSLLAAKMLAKLFPKQNIV